MDVVNLAFVDNPPLWLLDALFKAMLVAEAAGAKEIGVEHLLTAIESPSSEAVLAETRPEIPEILLPVPHRDMMLSAELVAILESLGDFHQMGVTDLQRALRRRE